MEVKAGLELMTRKSKRLQLMVPVSQLELQSRETKTKVALPLLRPHVFQLTKVRPRWQQLLLLALVMELATAPQALRMWQQRLWVRMMVVVLQLHLKKQHAVRT